MFRRPGSQAKILVAVLALIIASPLVLSCGSGDDHGDAGDAESHPIQNQAILQYDFLSDMDQDPYYPQNQVEKGEAILLRLCAAIERDKPVAPDDVYALTHAATIEFNGLAREFMDQGSEIETVARENIAADLAFVLSTYGYDLDIEEAIAPRDW